MHPKGKLYRTFNNYWVFPMKQMKKYSVNHLSKKEKKNYVNL